jgi:hypothetical protein
MCYETSNGATVQRNNQCMFELKKRKAWKLLSSEMWRRDVASAKVSEEPSVPILQKHSSTLKMEAVSSSQMLVNIYQIM